MFTLSSGRIYFQRNEQNETKRSHRTGHRAKRRQTEPNVNTPFVQTSIKACLQSDPMTCHTRTTARFFPASSRCTYLTRVIMLYSCLVSFKQNIVSVDSPFCFPGVHDPHSGTFSAVALILAVAVHSIEWAEYCKIASRIF